MQFLINLLFSCSSLCSCGRHCDIFRKQQYRMEGFELCLVLSKWKVSLVVVRELNFYEVIYSNDM